MISLELATKLKSAGLEWEPKEGDWFYYGDRAYLADGLLVHLNKGTQGKLQTHVFAPRLDQLLAEIEKHNYGYDLCNSDDKGIYELFLMKKEKFLRGWHEVYFKNEKGEIKEALFFGETPEEAAGQASSRKN